MADIYVRSTTGSDSNNGLSWATAKATLAGAAAIDVAGDTIYVSQAHNHTYAAASSIPLAGTLSAPVRIICADDATGEPPAASSSGGAERSTGSANITTTLPNSGIAFFKGLTFYPGFGSSAFTFWTLAGVYEDCSIVCGSSGGISLNLASNTPNRWNNVDITLTSGSSISIPTSGLLDWIGGSVSGGAFVFAASFVGHNAVINVRDVDFSGMDAAFNVLSTFGARGLQMSLVNCKLPAGWSGGLSTGIDAGCVFTIVNCASGSENYRYLRQTVFGNVSHETAHTRSGGASDGATSISWKMESNSSCRTSNPASCLASAPVLARNLIVGTSITVEVDVLHDSATGLKNDEIWLEVSYLASSSSPLGATDSDGKADVLAAGTDQAVSTASWVTTGMANPNKQKLSVTVTPEMVGYVSAVVKLAKPSYTIYVDPKLQVS